MNVLFETTGPIAVVSLNDLEKGGTLSYKALENLAQEFNRLSNDSNLRAMILECTGDTGVSVIVNEDEAKQTLHNIQAVCDAIEKCPVPVISVINGFVSGVALELVTACHLRVASETAEFNLSQTKLSLIPAYRLSRIVGKERANELLIAGKTIKADEALQIGFVNRVAPPDQVRHKAMMMAQEVTKLAPLAVQACLQAVIQGFDLPLNEGLKLETELFSKLFSSEDMREGTGAFLEKRQPVFQGR